MWFRLQILTLHQQSLRLYILYIYNIKAPVVWELRFQLWSPVSSAPAGGISLPLIHRYRSSVSIITTHKRPKAERICDWQQKNNWWLTIRKVNRDTRLAHENVENCYFFKKPFLFFSQFIILVCDGRATGDNGSGAPDWTHCTLRLVSVISFLAGFLCLPSQGRVVPVCVPADVGNIHHGRFCLESFLQPQRWCIHFSPGFFQAEEVNSNLNTQAQEGLLDKKPNILVEIDSILFSKPKNCLHRVSLYCCWTDTNKCFFIKSGFKWPDTAQTRFKIKNQY